MVSQCHQDVESGHRFTIQNKLREFIKTKCFLAICVTFFVLNAFTYYSTRVDTSLIYQPKGKSRPLVIKFDEKFWINKTERTILLWTTFFLEKHWVRILQEHFKLYDCNCVVTGNRDEITSADAVVFHALDLWFWEKLPKYRDPKQIWIIYVAEPTAHIHYTGMKWRFPRYTFNWTLSYRRDSTVYAPYGHFQVKEVPTDNVYNIAKNKSKMVASLIGNCHDDARRYRYLYELAKHTSVDFYGRCGNKTCPRAPGVCENILRPYKFKITFENSNCKNYVSEKFWNGIREDKIPIVNWKPWQKLPFAPQKSYINVFDFKTMKDLGDYLNYLNTNDTEYNSYFNWRNTFKVVHGDVVWHMFCTLCKRLKENPVRAQVVDYIGWMENDTCKPWSVSDIFRDILLSSLMPQTVNMTYCLILKHS